MAILETMQTRFTKVYGVIPPAVWTIITQLLQSLMAGCGGSGVKNALTKRPRLFQLRVEYNAVLMTDDAAEAQAIAKATASVVGESTAAELDEFAALKLPA